MAEVRTLKLITGEELIGIVVEERDDGTMIMEKTRCVQMMPTSPGQMGVGIVPYTPSNVDGEVKLYARGIIGEIKHTKEMEDAYLQQTTGIQLASAGGPII